MARIHPSAVVDPQAELAEDVEVGPLAHVGAGVRLGPGCILHPHATVLGPATFGANNVFFSHCAVGSAPQDLKYKGGPTSLQCGDGNQFRENVTIHRGTETDRHSGGITRIGDNNLFMVGVHVAHDAEVGNHCILANNVLLAGHVKLEDCVNVGGAAAMHHFVTVGRNAFVGGLTRVTHDVPPYVKIQGYDQEVRGLNIEGLKRWQFDLDSIRLLRDAFRLIYPRGGGRSAGRTVAAIRELRESDMLTDPHVRYLVDFLQRKLDIGVFGRARESLRTDQPADRQSFYGQSQPEGA